MKIQIRLISGMIMIMTMTGCPYESPVPLSDSCLSSPDPVLAGKWFYASRDRKNDTIEIVTFNEHEYYFETREKGKNGIMVTSRGRGFITLVKGNKIISYCSLDEPGKFIFFKYVILDNKMITWCPSDQFIKNGFKSSRELLAFFTKNLNKTGFFESADTFFRVRHHNAN